MVNWLIATAFALAFATSRWQERRLHRTNYDFLVSIGAEELMPRLMRRLYLFPWFALAAGLVEYAVVPRSWGREGLLIGSLLLLSAGALRFWAMRSLGVRWTMRCLAVPGQHQSNAGPYRFLSHPEYLSKTMEHLGTMALFTAPWTLAVGFALLLVLTRRISLVEARQLDELAGDRRRRDGLSFAHTLQ